MRKGQLAVLNKVTKEKIDPEVIKIFQDESYPVCVYPILYEIRKFGADVIKNNIDTIIKNKKNSWINEIAGVLCKYNNQISDRLLDILIFSEEITHGLYIADNLQLFYQLDDHFQLIDKINDIRNNKSSISLFELTIIFNFLDNRRKNIKKDIFLYFDYIINNHNKKYTLNNAKVEYMDFFRIYSRAYSSSQSYYLSDKEVLLLLSFKEDIPFDIFISKKYQNSPLKYAYNSRIKTWKNQWNDIIWEFCPVFGNCEYERFHSKKDAYVYDLIRKNEIEGTINIKKHQLKVKTSPNFIEFRFLMIDSIKFHRACNYPYHYSDDFIILLSIDGNIYYKLNGKKSDMVVPLTLKKLISKYEKSGNSFLKNFTDSLLLTYINKGYMIAKDLKEYADKEYFVLPGSINNIMQFHNKKELLSDYPIERNPNKNDINFIYITYKCLPYVNEKSKKYLQSLEDFSFTCSSSTSFTLNRNYIYESGISKYLSYVLAKRLNIEMEPDALDFNSIIRRDWSQANSQTIIDYINQCLLHRIPINLMFNSIKKLEEEHRRITEEIGIDQYLKDNTKVKIPQDSKFNALNEYLPKNFEWIKTKIRLATEAEMMHHCVYTYASRINKDLCAIYSIFDDTTNERYTLEFIITPDHKYALNQIQSSYDRGAPKELREMIISLIRDINEKIKKKGNN